MNLSENGKKFIKSQEACVLQTYQCSAGKDTIGFGHTGNDVTKGMTITLEQANALFDKDIAYFEAEVDKRLNGIDLSQHEFDALVSFAYNAGIANLFGNGKDKMQSTLIKKLKAGKPKNEIAAEFNKWVYASGMKNAGLIARRDKEAEMFLTGEYGYLSFRLYKTAKDLANKNYEVVKL